MRRSSRRGFGRPAPRQLGSVTGGRRSFGRRTAVSDPADLMLPTAYYAEPRRLPVGRWAQVAARRYIGWVQQSPDTRGLGTGLAALYPMGHLAHEYAAGDALLLGAFAPPAALAAWVATYKRHESPRYSATLAATAAGVPIWLATAAQVGIANLSTLLAYTATATATWSAYTWSDVLKHRRALAAQQAQWETIATGTELAGSRLVKTEPTHVGVRFKVDVGAGPDAPSVSRLLSGNLTEEIACLYGIGVNQVRLNGQASNARILWITLQLRDPWAQPVTHPALAPAAPAETTVTAAGGPLNPAPAQATPTKGCRSIMDGPFVLGTDPETGEDLELVVFDKGGARHVQVIATNGGGKTTLLSNIVEQANECRDVLVVAIDLRKGTIPHLWDEVLDASAGIGEQDKAIQILQWLETVAEERSRKNGGANHIPSPEAPVIILIIDEQAKLLGTDSDVAHLAKPIVDGLHQAGRSAGIPVITAGQRNVQQQTGSKEGSANAPTKIVLRVLNTYEMTKALDNWMTLGVPDMSTYAPGIGGVALLVKEGGAWQAGRIRDLSDFKAVRHLAVTRGRPEAHIEPDIAAQLPGYAERHLVTAGGLPPATSGGTDHRSTPPAKPEPSSGPSSEPTSGSAAGPPRGRDGSFGIDPDDDQAVTHAAEGLVAGIERHLAEMPQPRDAPIPLENLFATQEVFNNAETNPPEVNRKLPVPEDITHSVLYLLQQRGPDGARRDEIVAALGKPEGSVKRWLRIMVDQRVIARHGQGKALRYLLPQHSFGDHQR
ncbi:type IV secretory system conjugative DNA transfer family protein [Actinomadura kijaniata]|uniref:type IV secretory system conjugative DNA transfer family protein n=1 Tax=Actinomadura kijaniata TaxID=46161 RepID=UPI0008362EE9|nr:hypothetical protein [Actinomadura kijaniata]